MRLEPYPDLLFDEIANTAPGPDASYDAREAMSLAFVATLQLLNPRQRAVLVLRDVLGFRTREVAVMLDSTDEAVSSALKHARANLQSRLPPPGAPAPAPQSHAELAIVGRLVTAYEDGNVSALVSLLTDDVTVTAPMTEGAFVGVAAAQRLFQTIFAQHRSYRLIPTRANGQPAFGVYLRDPATAVFRANGMLVVTLAGDRVRAMTRFDKSVMAPFGLPRRLPEAR